jgi:hypothetical protein
MTATTATPATDTTPALDQDARLTIVAATIVRAGLAAQHADGAVRDAGQAFIVSAIATRDALAEGVSAVAIARAVKARVEAGDVPARFVYTSDPAVGFHALTGAFYALPGQATEATPDGRARAIAPQDVQMMIKKLGQRVARPLVEGADDQGTAYARLVKALKAKSAATPAPVSGEDGAEGGEGGEGAEDVPATVAALIGNARTILAGARKRGLESEEDGAALAALATYVAAWVKAETRKAERAHVAAA